MRRLPPLNALKAFEAAAYDAGARPAATTDTTPSGDLSSDSDSDADTAGGASGPRGTTTEG